MGYSMDMNEEKRPSYKVLLPEGWRKFKIVGCVEKKSKSGNMMFVFTAEDVDTGYEDTWYAVAEAGKRWFLKTILDACGCPIKDGVYEWDIDKVIGKYVMGLVVHEPNEYINREGEKVSTTQHRVQEIKSVGDDQVVEWED